MVHRSSPRGEPSAVPVVLCCALGEEADVEEVGRALRERGLPVEVLVGVELDPRALAAAIDRWRGEGLYVLCRAGALDRTRIDALREVLLARRVPFGRTLTVGASTRAELLERIEQGLKKLGPTARPTAASTSTATATTTETNAGGTTRPRRATIPVIPATITRALQNPPAGATAPAAAKRPSRTLPPAAPPPRKAGTAAATRSEPMAAPPPAAVDAAVRDPGDVTFAGVSEAELPGRADDETQTKQPDTSVSAMELDANAVEQTQTKQPDTSVTAAEVDPDLLEDEEDVTRLRPKHDDDELPSLDLEGMLAAIGDGPDPAARGNTVVARSDTAVASGNTVVARSEPLISRITLKTTALPLDGHHEDIAEVSLSDGEVIVDRTQVVPAQRPPPIPATTTMPSPRVPEPDPAPTTDAEAASGGHGKLLVAAVVGALGLGVLGAVLVANRDDPRPTPSAPPDAAGAGEVVADARKAGVQPDATPETPDADAEAKADDANAEAGGDAKPDADAKGDAKADAGDTKPERGDDDASASRPALAGATVKPRLVLPTTARKPAVPSPPKTRVQLALRERAVRALDILLVARRPSKPLPFADAQKHCESLDVLGIQGWRLPDVGELASLGDAGMLGRVFYWSQTSGDTFGDTHMAWNGRMGQAASRSKAAVALCVRGDRGEAP